MPKKPVKLNIAMYLNEQQRDEAMKDYLMAHPELAENMFQTILKQDMIGNYTHLFYTVRGELRDMAKPILKLYKERAIFAANQLVSNEEFVDSLIPMEEFVESVKKELRSITREKDYLRRVIRQTVDEKVTAKLKELVDVDPLIKNFQDQVAARIRELISQTTVDAEVDRLMGRRNK